MKEKRLILIVILACAIALGGSYWWVNGAAQGPQSPTDEWLLQGMVFAGQVGDESHPLEGVTIAVYGADSSYPTVGTFLRSTTTDAAGRYGLLVYDDDYFNFFYLLESDPDGYVSVDATSVGGEVKTPNWIEFTTITLGNDVTGNKFWDFGSDLIMEDLIVEPTPAYPDEIVELTARVRSEGAEEFHNVPVSFLVGGEPIATEFVESFPPASVVSVTVSHVFSTTGLVQMSAIVNPDGSLLETNPDNNSAETDLELVWEKDPPWGKPDLTLSNLQFTPHRPDPGQGVEVTADLILVRALETSIPVVLMVDYVVVEEQLVNGLEPDGTHPLVFHWNNPTPGRHSLKLVVDPEDRLKERNEGNNYLEDWVRVSGASNPRPDLEVENIDLSIPALNPGESTYFTITIGNEGYASATNVPVLVTLDGHELSRVEIPDLPAGGQAEFAAAWDYIDEGEHLLGVWIDPDDMLNTDSLRLHLVQSLVVPGAMYVLPPAATPADWTPIGPYSINNDAYVGRIDSIDISDQDTLNMVVGAPAGGVWTTSSGGSTWTARGDRLASPGFSVVKFDPSNDKVIYAGSGSSRYGNGTGLYKSLDFGAHWSKFAGTWLGNGYAELIFVENSPTTITIYAATNTGVWRWKGSRSAKTTALNDWDRIWQQQQTSGNLNSKVVDMLLTAETSPKLYISVLKDVVYWVALSDLNSAPYASKWKYLDTNLPLYLTTITLGNSASNSSRVYAAVKRTTGELEIYRSDSGGDWVYRGSPSDTHTKRNTYNAFIAVHPKNADILYIGGVQGYRSIDGGKTFPYVLPVVHDDYKAMAFDPDYADFAYFVSDGGVYICGNNRWVMSCSGLNHDLATTMFFDIALARTKDQRVIGGTQDNGTLITDGSLYWTNLSLKGDGRYVAIDPNDADTMFAQYQYSDSVYSSTHAGPPWKLVSSGLPKGGNDPFMVMHPNDGRILLMAQDQVYRTTNAGGTWSGIGPAVNLTDGSIKRVVIDGVNNRYYAGTTRGEIWAVAAGITGDMYWTRIYIQNNHQEVRSMLVDPGDPSILYVTFAGNQALRVVKLDHSGSWPGTTNSWSVTDMTGSLVNSLFGSRRLFGPNRGGGQWDVVRGLIKDPNANIFYAGTDRGVYRGEIINGAWEWYPDSCDFPLTYVSDLELDSSGTILTAATYGRSAYERPLVNFAPDKHDSPTRNDTMATSAYLGQIQNDNVFLVGLYTPDLTLDRFNDVDYYTIKMPPKASGECFPAGDSSLNDWRCSQCMLSLRVEAPDSPYPYQVTLHNSDGSPFTNYTTYSNVGFVLERPRDFISTDVFSISVKNTTGCLSAYRLYASYTKSYCEIDVPEILYDPPLVNFIVPELKDFAWMFPGDPTLINQGYVGLGPEQLPEQRVIFHWDESRDFEATFNILGLGNLDAVLYGPDGGPIASTDAFISASDTHGTLSANSKEINVADLAAGWYALGLNNGDFPTFFNVDFNVPERLYLPIIPMQQGETTAQNNSTSFAWLYILGAMLPGAWFVWRARR